MAHIALLGTGLIGSGMVEAMVGRGHTVRVWNRTEAKAEALAARLSGVVVAATPAAAVAGAERVHLVLSDDAAVDAVLAGLPPIDAPIVDHSTTSPAGTAARAAALAAKGQAFAHAPIFMSPAAAQKAAGLVLLASTAAVRARVEPALATMTGAVWWVGERPDLAAAYKLFGNAMILTLAAGLTDVFRMGKALGVSPTDAHALFSHFDPTGALKVRGAKMAAGDFTPSFETTMARKDVRLMLETVEGLELLPAVAAMLDRAIAEGHGAADVGAIAASAR
ncbi:MAG: NAD(P)-dependent oxidoreductase [Deltaproteobacteria bacterium]|nr:NAD(P)-dependent oxidoreductase [Deltaproteobacteria bacterium]